MTLYSCKTCFKTFNRKSSYISHTEKKKYPCKTTKQIPEESNNMIKEIKNATDNNTKLVEENKNVVIPTVTKQIQCKYCLMVFTRSDSLKKHIENRCKTYKEQLLKEEQFKNKVYDDLINKIAELDEKIKDNSKQIEQKIKVNNEIKVENINNDIKLELINKIRQLEKTVKILEKNQKKYNFIMQHMMKETQKTSNLKNNNDNNDDDIDDKINNLLTETKESLKYIKKRIPSTLRSSVWSSYFGRNMDGTCQCCKLKNITFENFDCGHIISERLGGSITLDNLKPICRLCNNSMGTQNMNDFMKEYGFDKDNEKI